MNWLDLARAGENCPQATERSFSAHERAKWERAAEYTNRSGGTAPGCEPGDLPDYPGVTAGKDEHDRARERGASPEMPPWPPIYRLPSRHFHEDDIEFSVRQDVESALRARDERIASLEESLRIHVKLYTDSHSVEFEQRDQIASLERKLDLAHEAVRGRNDLAEAAQALGELWDGLMAGRQHSYVVRAAIEKIKALEAENARLTSRLSRTEELWLKHTGEMVPIMESREDAWSENERIKAENARLRGDLEQSILDGKGTAKLLAIAERDRNRAEAIAAALRDGDCHDACEAPDKCERCGKPATHDTADWVPLCKACYDALSVDPSPAAQDRRETNEQNTAQRDAGERGTPRPQEDGITAITTPSGTVPLSQPDSPAPQATRETDTGTGAPDQTQHLGDDDGHEKRRHVRDGKGPSGGDGEAPSGPAGREGRDVGGDGGEGRIPRTDGSGERSGARVSGRRKDAGGSAQAIRRVEGGHRQALAVDRANSLPRGADGGGAERDAPGLLLSEQGTEVALGAESRHRSQASAPLPSPASPSLPSWPKREQPKTLYDVVVDAREATAWRDAACLEIKRLQAIIDAAKEALC